nr:immunoglobulin heavy chain junction region [Macaca mulatta]
CAKASSSSVYWHFDFW